MQVSRRPCWPSGRWRGRTGRASADFTQTTHQKSSLGRLKNNYLTAVTASGAGAGAGGVVPGWGVPLTLADVMAFTEATILYTLCVAEVHGLDPEDLERRKLLVLTVLLGDSAIGALEQGIKRTGPYWARGIVESIPMSAINRANKVLGPRFITKYGTKQGVLVLSKQVPLGIGAALGGGGNHLFARATVSSARKIFGPAPTSWDSFLVTTSDRHHATPGDLDAVASDAAGRASATKMNDSRVARSMRQEISAIHEVETGDKA